MINSEGREERQTQFIFVCTSMALLYGELEKAKVDLLNRLAEGQFLTMPELGRLASAVQYRIEDLEEVVGDPEKSNVIHRRRIGLRRGRKTTKSRAGQSMFKLKHHASVTLLTTWNLWLAMLVQPWREPHGENLRLIAAGR